MMVAQRTAQLRHISSALTKLQQQVGVLIAQEQPITEPNVWQETAGVLKNKIKIDPVQWQRKIRSEWDHRS